MINIKPKHSHFTINRALQQSIFHISLSLIFLLNYLMASPQEFEASPSTIIVNYKECGRNYAIAVGGHAVDGCREFAPSGEQGTRQALLCQACSCHRSFHRKEVIGDGVVHTTHLAAPPSTVALGQPVALMGAVFPMIPYVDYNYSTMPKQPSDEISHHDHDDEHHAEQNKHGFAMNGGDQIQEANPNGFKIPKVEPF